MNETRLALFNDDFLPLLESLEQSVQKKVESIVRGGFCRTNQNYHHRILKVGSFRVSPLHIHYQPLLSRRFVPYFGIDRVTNILSLAEPTLPLDFHDAIKHILLLPELVLSSKHLLSQIYIPKAKVIVFYLCPKRFLPNQLCIEDFERHASLKKRMEGDRSSLDLLGIWGWGLRRSLDCALSHAKPLQKFLLDSSLLCESDIAPLQEIHDVYIEKQYNSVGFL